MSNLGNRELKPEEFDAFVEALKKAFSTTTFDTMLLQKLGQPRDSIATTSGFENIVPEVIHRLQQENETQKLLEAALAMRPANSHLCKFAERFGIHPPTPDHVTSEKAPLIPDHMAYATNPLEQQVRPFNTDLDPALFRKRLEQYEKQVCFITIQLGGGEKIGTGFLFGSHPDVIITNYHLMKEIIHNPSLASGVTCYFDYKLREDEKAIDRGTPYKLAKD